MADRKVRSRAPPPLPPLPKALGTEQQVSGALAEAKAAGLVEEEDLIEMASAAMGSAVRVVFLDVDGVLNSKTSRAQDDLLSPDMLEQLRFIVNSTQCKIVLSSTWRLQDHTKSQVESTLLQCGLGIKGSTPDLVTKGRGDRVDEILLWLELRGAKSERVDAWIAIDDIDLVSQNSRMDKLHFVHTSDDQGLTPEKAQEALRKLLAQA